MAITDTDVELEFTGVAAAVPVVVGIQTSGIESEIIVRYSTAKITAVPGVDYDVTFPDDLLTLNVIPTTSLIDKILATALSNVIYVQRLLPLVSDFDYDNAFVREKLVDEFDRVWMTFQQIDHTIGDVVDANDAAAAAAASAAEAAASAAAADASADAAAVSLAAITPVTPEAYGAIGDGVADDTVALQAALNAAANGTLYLTKGYLVSNTINWTKPCRVVGSGARPGGARILIKPSMSLTADVLALQPDILAQRATWHQWSIQDVMICGQGNEGAIYGGSVAVTPGGRDAIAINLPDVNETVTVSIASPAVVSWTAHGLPVGTAFKFSTTGALPTGITVGTTYYVIAAGLTANSFQFAATLGGAAINTSGSQSGTQSAYVSFLFLSAFQMHNCVITGINRRCFTLTRAGADVVIDNLFQSEIDNCYFQNGLANGDAVLYFSKLGDSNIISHNKIVGKGYGIFLQVIPHGAAQNMIRDNNITADGTSIYIDTTGAGQVKVMHNQIEHTQPFTGNAAENACIYLMRGAGIDIVGNNISAYSYVHCIRLATSTNKTVIENNFMDVNPAFNHLVLDADAGAYNNFGGGNRFTTSGAAVTAPRLGDGTSGAGLNRITGLFGPTTTTPTPVSAGGVLTTAAANVKTLRFGNLVFLEVFVSITTNGSGSAYIDVPLPVTVTAANHQFIVGRDVSFSAGKMLRGWISPNTAVLHIHTYDGLYPGVDGAALYLNGVVFVD